MNCLKICSRLFARITGVVGWGRGGGSRVPLGGGGDVVKLTLIIVGEVPF